MDMINYEYLEKMGIKCVIFDKDDTLTVHLKDNFYDEKLQETILYLIKNNSFNGNIYLVSNGFKKMKIE